MVFCSIAIEMKDHGGGINVVDVPDSELKIFTKHYQDVQMIARTSIFFAKLAILLLYIRIFYPKGTYRTALWWVIQAVIWLNLLYTVSLILAISLQCVPFNRPFGTSCANQYAILLSASTINTISDIAVLVIPMGSLWKLQMSRNKKLSVWALFAFGALAPLFSITRLLYQITQASGDNKTVIAETVLLLALAEQVVSIVTGCMPVVSVFFIRRVFKKGSSGKPSGDPNRTLTQRFWPNRESGSPRRSWPSRPKHKGPSNPYSLGTLRDDGTFATSEDGFFPGSKLGGAGQMGQLPDEEQAQIVTKPNNVISIVSTSTVTRSEGGPGYPRGLPVAGHEVEVMALNGREDR